MNKSDVQIVIRVADLKLRAGIKLPPKKQPKILPADAGENPKLVEKIARAK